MSHSVSNSNTFLAYFNHIDKFFEVVLGLTAYMPFTEKVDKIAQGRYAVSSFVRKQQHKLKYFGDLRNQVVHGFRLEQHHYLLASDYAVMQIKTIYEHLTKPPTIHTWCTQKIPYARTDTTMQEVITLITQADLPALPIQDTTGAYHDTIFLKQIVSAALQQDFLSDPVEKYLKVCTTRALFMSSDASVYEIEGLFSTLVEDEEYNELIWITATGHPDEEIIGIITAVDLPKLDQEVIL